MPCPLSPYKLIRLLSRQISYPPTNPTYPSIGDGDCDPDDPSCGPYPVVVLHDDEHPSLALGAVIAIVIIVILILLAIALVLFLLRRRRRARAGGVQNGGGVCGGGVGGGAKRGFLAKFFGRERRGPTMSPTRDITLDPEYRMHDLSGSGHGGSARSAHSRSGNSMTGHGKTTAGEEK